MSIRETILPAPGRPAVLDAYIVNDWCDVCSEPYSDCVCAEPEDSERPTKIDAIPASEECR